MPRQHVASFTDAVTGRPRRVRCRTLQQKRALEAKHREAREQVRLGLATPEDIAARRRREGPIEAAVDAWICSIEKRGRTAAHCDDQRRAVTRLIENLNFNRPIDIDAQAVADWIDQQAGAPRTRNRYRKAFRAWCRWMQIHHWMVDNPSLGVELEPDEANAVVRRPLTPGEAWRLFAVPGRGPDYQILAATGLRWTEAEALTTGCIEDGVLCVPRGIGKTDRDRDSWIPLGRLAMAAIAARRVVGDVPLLARRKPDGRAFGRDLAAAKIQKRTPMGVLAPASMRKTFTTWLASAGVDLPTVMRLRRDRGPLAEARYTERAVLIDEMRRGIERMERWLDEPALRQRNAT